MGDGISSYMVFKVNTRTNVTYFKRKDMSVSRRFSDFLGLHDKLSEKYLQNGRVVPPAPDKSLVGMTKIKMSKEAAAAAMAGGEENGTTVTAAAQAPDEVRSFVAVCVSGRGWAFKSNDTMVQYVCNNLNR